MLLKTFQPYVMLRGRVLRDKVPVAAKSKWEGGAASWGWWGPEGQVGDRQGGGVEEGGVPCLPPYHIIVVPVMTQ